MVLGTWDAKVDWLSIVMTLVLPSTVIVDVTGTTVTYVVVSTDTDVLVTGRRLDRVDGKGSTVT